MGSIERDIDARLKKLEQQAVTFRLAIVMNVNPLQINLGVPGTDPNVAAQTISGLTLNVFDTVACLRWGKDFIVLGRPTNSSVNSWVSGGSTDGPTTTSTANPPTAVIPQMSITADFGGRPLLIIFSATLQVSGVNLLRYWLFDNGSEIPNGQRFTQLGGGEAQPAVNIVRYTPPAGNRTIDVRWSVSGGTGTANGVNRSLVICRA